MPQAHALVVTSISGPNEVLKTLAAGCQANNIEFFLIGDVASPRNFQLDGCRFHGIDDQLAAGFAFAQLCPVKHYARKNIGYLLAARAGATVILETDDDNAPLKEFWSARTFDHAVPTVADRSWTNVYRYFSSENIWPRGLPLERIKSEPVTFESLQLKSVHCPIQQGMCDGDPDVDAVFRLIAPAPGEFRKDRRVALSSGSWCPFNSQNTTWSHEAMALMYLPAYCSFRMTDIWRSFVAQRICWTNDWSILFHEATMHQGRNEHNLLKDFADEVPGYLNNAAMCEALEALPLKRGVENIQDNLRVCYEKLVSMRLVDGKELTLLDAWLSDLKDISTDSDDYTEKL